MFTRRQRRSTARLLAIVLLTALVATATMLEPSPPEAQAAGKPNIILITTDDMADTDLAWMPKTARLLQNRGVGVEDFLSNHPVCCPARAQIFTGQYAHNNGVRTNSGPYGGYPSLVDKGNNIGSWLKAAGYRTAFVGKHMNGWPPTAHHMPGWTIFNPFLGGVYHPFRITTFNNGRPKFYTGTHTSDLVGQLTTRYIKRFSASGRPFFIWASQVSPHGMKVRDRWVDPIPAKRHRDLYPDVLPPALSRASFNEPDSSDKPSYIQELSDYPAETAIAHHRARIRSLRSVDDQVAAAVRALAANGELDNTYIFFTSDNGFLLGEHRWAGKNVPYEESLQVPLLVRGPGVPEGVTRDATYGLVDLAPTFLDLAGATSGRTLDGRSMMSTLRDGAPGYGSFLVQAARGQTEPWWWRGVRTGRYTYVKYSDGFEELYDRVADPEQVDNVAGDPAHSAVLQEHVARLTQLENCAGETCLDVAP